MEQPVRRRRRRKKKTLNANLILIAGCVIGAVALIVAACILFGSLGGDDASVQSANPERKPLPELTVGEITRDAERMVVDTSYMDLAFPYAFSDLITVQAVNQEKVTGLIFRAKIAGEDRDIYTIWFNGAEGQDIGTYDPKDGDVPVVVRVVFAEPVADWKNDDRVTFFATQETFNDVLAAMKGDERFTEKP